MAFYCFVGFFFPQIQIQDIWTLPVSATKYRKLSGVESLKQFINEVTMPNGNREFLNITREQSTISQVTQKYKSPTFNIRNPLTVQFRSSGTAELGVMTKTTLLFNYHR